MPSEVFSILKKELKGVQKNVLLSAYTTFKIGGPAEYFFIAKTSADIIKATAIARKLELPLFVFGGGSNLLISEKGIQGLVVKINNEELKIKKDGIISVGAGVSFKDLVDFSVKESLQGFEWAGGLPGTVGGAIRGNAGAFGGEVKDLIFQVEALDKTLHLHKLTKRQCRFAYRDSIFKQRNWIVISVLFTMKKGNKKGLQETVNARIAYRRERHPLEYPNAGSIFKNIPLSEFSEHFKESLAGVVKQDPFPVVPMAYLISELGLKGTKIGKAQISEKHPNFIVNRGGAYAGDVLALIDLVKNKIKEKFGVTPEVEVQHIGI